MLTTTWFLCGSSTHTQTHTQPLLSAVESGGFQRAVVFKVRPLLMPIILWVGGFKMKMSPYRYRNSTCWQFYPCLISSDGFCKWILGRYSLCMEKWRSFETFLFQWKFLHSTTDAWVGCIISDSTSRRLNWIRPLLLRTIVFVTHQTCITVTS